MGLIKTKLAGITAMLTRGQTFVIPQINTSAATTAVKDTKFTKRQAIRSEFSKKLRRTAATNRAVRL